MGSKQYQAIPVNSVNTSQSIRLFMQSTSRKTAAQKSDFASTDNARNVAIGPALLY